MLKPIVRRMELIDNTTLIKMATDGDKTAEDILVDRNLPLVHSCVKKLIRQGFEYDDLVQVGSIGLVKALRKFDTSLGLKLSTYAVPLIMGEIKRYMRDYSTLKVSRTHKELWLKVVRVREILTKKLLREPGIGEIAKEIGVDVEKVIIAMEACRPCESLQSPVGNDGKNDIFLADMVSSDSTPEKDTEIIALKGAINSLGQRERKIIILRYFMGKTQCEVSKIIGVSQVQISRIEKKILENLRNMVD